MSPDYYSFLICLSIFIISIVFHYFSALNTLKGSFLLAAVISILLLLISLNVETYYFKITADSGETYKGNIVIPIITSITFIVVFITSIISGIMVNYFKNAKINKI